MTVTFRLPPASVRVLAVMSSQVIRVSIPGSTGGSGGGGPVSAENVSFDDTGLQVFNGATVQAALVEADARAVQLEDDVAFKENSVNKGVAGGYAPLGPDSKVPDANLPAYEASGAAVAAVATHVAAPDPHTQYAPKASPALTGTPTAPTATAGTNTTQIATTAFVDAAVNAIIAAADAMVFKGVVDCSANPNYPAADRGWTYKVSVAGKIGGASGVNVEVGDTLICLTDGTASGDHATVGAQWNITQANLDGAVIGPASSVDGYFALFSGSSGKLLTSVSPTAVKAALAIGISDVSGLQTALDAKQATLISQTNIKSIHGLSVLGSGDFKIPGNFVAPPIVGSFMSGALTGVAPAGAAMASDRLELYPYPCQATHTADQIGVRRSSGVASSAAKVVIYSSGTDGWPDALLFEGASMTGLASGGGATVTVDASDFQFVAGVTYWIGLLETGTGQILFIPTTGLRPLGSSGAANYTIIRRTHTYTNPAPNPLVFNSADLVASATAPYVVWSVQSVP